MKAGVVRDFEFHADALKKEKEKEKTEKEKARKDKEKGKGKGNKGKGDKPTDGLMEFICVIHGVVKTSFCWGITCRRLPLVGGLTWGSTDPDGSTDPPPPPSASPFGRGRGQPIG